MQETIASKDAEIIHIKAAMQDQAEELQRYSAAYEELKLNFDRLLSAYSDMRQEMEVRDIVMSEYHQVHDEVCLFNSECECGVMLLGVGYDRT